MKPGLPCRKNISIYSCAVSYPCASKHRAWWNAILSRRHRDDAFATSEVPLGYSMSSLACRIPLSKSNYGSTHQTSYVREWLVNERKRRGLTWPANQQTSEGGRLGKVGGYGGAVNTFNAACTHTYLLGIITRRRHHAAFPSLTCRISPTLRTSHPHRLIRKRSRNNRHNNIQRRTQINRDWRRCIRSPALLSAYNISHFHFPTHAATPALTIPIILFNPIEIPLPVPLCAEGRTSGV